MHRRFLPTCRDIFTRRISRMETHQYGELISCWNSFLLRVSATYQRLTICQKHQWHGCLFFLKKNLPGEGTINSASEKTTSLGRSQANIDERRDGINCPFDIHVEMPTWTTAAPYHEWWLIKVCSQVSRSSIFIRLAVVMAIVSCICLQPIDQPLDADCSVNGKRRNCARWEKMGIILTLSLPGWSDPLKHDCWLN